ncbi:MAG: 3'-5' exonuclease [Pseudomonadota bacterium]
MALASLPLRLRIFLLFGLVAGGGVAATGGALWLAYRQLDEPAALSALVTGGVVSTLGILAVSVFVWLLFDENVAKPIEALAAKLRVGTHGKAATVEADAAPYLGDLAPAAAALHDKMSGLITDASESAAEQVERLLRHQRQLLQVLSDVPAAVLLLTREHQIALYDGQAAALMAAEAPLRLNGSLFDYLEDQPIRDVVADLRESGPGRRAITVTGRRSGVYSGHIRLLPERDCYALMLEPLDVESERPPIFDFDLLEKTGSADLEATPLRDLCFVVFDSETTGLDPERDDVVQIGAVRVVNGRRVPGETFETLVDPGRSIPARSTEVHGIDDAMVAGAPRFGAVCKAFHLFAEDAVIVAHNAPFDMAFLARAAPERGVTFDHPVLDTVHLSAIVFGGSATHTLDALCDRLGVTIPAALRHTAMGDAVATADVFTAMIPILEARGFRTLGEVRAEARKHTRILEALG